ncbi:MAG TPA: AraC family transcriptional regulator [Opitutus sp.]|nr:AraC family transcriptional regulator [Opitutus sp.]
MRAIFQKIRPHENSSLCCRRTTGETFSGRWHFHPELEIMFVERSRGLRFVGDSVQPFGPGDLVLVGPNLPHEWLNTDVPARPRHDHAIGIWAQFRADFLGDGLRCVPELAAVAALLERSRHGLHFTGPVVAEVAGHLRRMAKGLGVARLADLLLILDLLAHSPSGRVLSSAGYVPRLNHEDALRIEKVCRWVHGHLAEEIAQPAAAAQAALSPTCFSRFFRRKMGCTFPAYVTELRIARAANLMVEENMRVADACFASGFKNLSHFNCQFRRLKGMNPRTFLRHCGANPAGGEPRPDRGIR